MGWPQNRHLPPSLIQPITGMLSYHLSCRPLMEVDREAYEKELREAKERGEELPEEARGALHRRQRLQLGAAAVIARRPLTIGAACVRIRLLRKVRPRWSSFSPASGASTPRRR